MEAFSDWRFIMINLWPLFTAAAAFVASMALGRRAAVPSRFRSRRRDRHRPKFRAVTVLEAAAISLVCFLVLLLVWNGFRDSLFTRTEQINGVVTKKDTTLSTEEEKYDCNCTASSPGNKTCQTCYRTHYYKTFNLYNSTGRWWGGSVQGDRLEYVPPTEPDAPESWQNAYIGMPVSLDHSYANYLAADGTSPFIPPTQPYQAYKALIPPAPFQPMSDPARPWRRDVKDKVVTIGFEDPRLESWNLAPGPVPEDASAIYKETGKLPAVPLYLDTLNGFLGPVFQSDLYLIFADRQPLDVVEATLAFWQRGPKNAIYVYLFGEYDAAAQRFTADNARVEFGVPSNYALQTQLQSRLLDYIGQSQGQIERESLLGLIVDQIMKPADQGGFNRQEMSSYAALKQSIHPTSGQLWLSFSIVALIDLIGKVLAYFLGR